MKPEHLGQPGALGDASAPGAMRVSADRKGVLLEGVAEKVFVPGNKPFSVSLWVKPSGFAKGDFGTPFACGAANVGAAACRT